MAGVSEYKQAAATHRPAFWSILRRFYHGLWQQAAHKVSLPLPIPLSMVALRAGPSESITEDLQFSENNLPHPIRWDYLQRGKMLYFQLPMRINGAQ
jgi:hypothetical protein